MDPRMPVLNMKRRPDWFSRMLWRNFDAIMFCFCAALVALTIPYGKPFDPFALEWLWADFFAVAMLVFWSLWASSGAK